MIQCPNCSRENSEKSRFCQFCGGTLATVALQQPPAPSIYSPPANPSPQIYQPAAPPQPYQSPLPRPVAQVGGGGTAAGSIWGPFAGYGTRGRHVSWLLDNLGERAEALHQTIAGRFEQRKVPNSAMRPIELTGKGIWVERRPFYFIQRGITTVALYIARFGQDLYISQVTYAKSPLSLLRAVILAMMVLFELFTIFSYVYLADSLFSFGFGGDALASIFLLCMVGPAGFINTLLLGFIFLFSCYKWLRERDFLAILRTPPNEFELDDINALEKSVEETVRQSLDAIGISADLMPPAVEKSFQRSLLRLI